MKNVRRKDLLMILRSFSNFENLKKELKAHIIYLRFMNAIVTLLKNVHFEKTLKNGLIANLEI